jgi:SAM-dependent methyltransferase
MDVEQLKVQQFYDNHGWTERNGQTVDAELFGDREIGPIRQAGQAFRWHQIRQALGGSHLRLLECGCGGNPAVELLDLCSHYTAVDFSATGLAVSNRKLQSQNVPFSLQLASVCALPFKDGEFDAVYSAHVFYHIANVEAQRQAFEEAARVVRPGGRVVLILANARPLLCWGRLVRRLVADWNPAVANFAPRGPLPYNPRPIGWMRGVLEKFGTVDVQCHALPSVWFNQHVSEFGAVGRALWRTISHAERKWPVARLGCFIQITLHRR